MEKRLVSDVMRGELVTVSEPMTIGEAASMMAQRRIGSVLLMEGGKLAGIFTERDIVRALSQNFDAARDLLTHWMTRDPMTVSPETELETARKMMVRGGFRHLPVLEGRRVVGIISMRDVLAAGPEPG